LYKPAGDVRLSFQFKDRRAQRAVIKSTRARGRECVVIASTTTNALSLILTRTCATYRAAFPADRLITAKQRRFIPA